MSTLALVAAQTVLVWVALVVIAQVVNPEQSPLSMGMSGLARGHRPWIMKTAFVVRGASALLLVASLPAVLRIGKTELLAIALFWVWGVGSAMLAVADTDMPGEASTTAGRTHALVALVAYVAGVTGAVLISVQLLRGDATSAAGPALALALSALVALVAQFAGFGAAARAAGSGAAVTSTGAAAAPAASAAPAWSAAVTASAAAVPPQLPAGVAPQLSTIGAAAAVPRRGARSAAPAGNAPPPASASLGSSPAPLWLAGPAWLGDWAGLLQRVFLGLLMAWTMLVAIAIAVSK